MATSPRQHLVIVSHVRLVYNILCCTCTYNVTLLHCTYFFYYNIIPFQVKHAQWLHSLHSVVSLDTTLWAIQLNVQFAQVAMSVPSPTRYLKSVLLGIILLPEVSNAYRVAKDISAREMVQANEQGIYLMLEYVQYAYTCTCISTMYT